MRPLRFASVLFPLACQSAGDPARPADAAAGGAPADARPQGDVPQGGGAETGAGGGGAAADADHPPGDAAAGGASDASPPPLRDAQPHGGAPADASPPPGDAATGLAVCEGTYGRPVEAGVLDDDRLSEVSGIAASPTVPGVLWMHNDSGDLARLYAVTTSGHLLGVLYLRGVENVDFEDLAAGPCPPGLGAGRACLWVADTGNNRADRVELVVHVVPEPAVDPVGGFDDIAAEEIWHFPFRYPDQPRDSEAFALAPDASTFYVFEKMDGAPTHVYRHPGNFADGRRADLVPVATFDAPGFDIPLGHMVTGASLHPGGRRLLLRVYTGSYEYRLPDGAGWESIAELSPERVAAGPLSEPQGEAITYDGAGTGIYTVSEDADRSGRVPLHFYPCQR